MSEKCGISLYNGDQGPWLLWKASSALITMISDILIGRNISEPELKYVSKASWGGSRSLADFNSL